MARPRNPKKNKFKCSTCGCTGKAKFYPSQPYKCKKCSKEYQTQYCKDNPEVVNRARRTWSAKHFFKSKASRLAGLTHLDLARIWKRQRGRCALCGDKLTPDNAVVDHIHPKSKGGSLAADNVQWVTHAANVAKADLSMEALLDLCHKIIETCDHE